MLRHLSREPLVGFTMMALAIFGFDAMIGEPEQETIVLSPDSVELLIDNRAAMLGRDLTQEERQQIFQNLADQEVLVREAVKLGLYMHDPITRKRMIDQMHFLMAKRAPDPTREDLERLRAERPDRYLYPRTISFEHVFFMADPEPARQLLLDLTDGAAVPDGAGDRFWLGQQLEEYTISQLLTLLGHDFVQSLNRLEPGTWAGPVRSARGWHVLRIIAFHDPKPLPDRELQRRLREDWEAAYRRQTYDAQLADMRQHYRVDLADTPPDDVRNVSELVLGTVRPGRQP
ncbi:peptidyl-prolyl cis-trans isomerase [Ruegeria sediminis]|nr:peptidylprolyl isomerase [Ruegeria sediminis]